MRRGIASILIAASAAGAFQGCVTSEPSRLRQSVDQSIGPFHAPCCVLDKHTGRVTHVAFAPRSNRLVSLSEDGFDRSTIIFWDGGSGSVIDSFTNENFLDRDVVFAPGGGLIGIGSRTAVLIRSDNYRLRRAFEPETYDFFRTVDVAVNSFAWPFAFKTYQVEQRYRYVISLAFSPDGRYLASGHENGQVKVWEIKTGALLNVLWGTRVFGGVIDVEFSPDGRFIAACQDDEKIRVWRFPDYAERILDGHERAVYSIDFDPIYGRLVSAGVGGKVRIWDVESGRTLETFRAHGKAIMTVEFSEDGRTIVTGSKDNTVRIWDAATHHMIAQLEGHDRQVNAVSLNSNATLLASSSDDATVRIWDISAFRLCDNIALTPEPLYPAGLSGEVVFRDDTGDGALAVGERGSFVVKIRNEGEGAAFNIVTMVTPDTLIQGMEIERPEIIPMILPGRTASVSIDISNGSDTDISGAGFTFRVLESNGFHLNPPLKFYLKRKIPGGQRTDN